MAEVSATRLKSLFQQAGAVRLLAKRLAENDNSKNQVYLGGSFELLTLLPFESPTVVVSDKGNSVIHASLRLSWLTDDGAESRASHAKLILYPQYPEVRLSGFLRGSLGAPAELMNEHARIVGRVLFLGVRADRSIVARVYAPDALVVRELQATGIFDLPVAIVEIPLEKRSSRDLLLETLGAISAEEWIDSQRLGSSGETLPCEAMNCGGLTLEAKLRIIPNSRSEPDFHGWEVKQFAVRDFKGMVAKSPITLFTPEPTTGVYADEGVVPFIRRYGYPDTKGRPDRLNFGGKFLVDRRDERTQMTLRIQGYDVEAKQIVDPSGGLAMVDDAGVTAAGWPFTSLIEHWNRKHAAAAYVPSMFRNPPRQYRFGSSVSLSEGTDFGRFLRAMADGIVYYDPGIKLEEATTISPKPHRRSQFRIAFSKLSVLYRLFARVEALPRK
jgi:hypothetical protein